VLCSIKATLASSLSFLSFSMKHYSTSQDLSLLILRLIVGGVFIYAGFAKWFIWSTPMEGMSDTMILLTKFLSIVEPIGGAALILGFLTRWAGAGLAIIMLGSFYFVYQMGSSFFTGMQGIGMDYNVLLFAGSLILVTFAAGKWSVDRLMKMA
jgi:putative oxidoreductase